jgi:hypothetical protein
MNIFEFMSNSPWLSVSLAFFIVLAIETICSNIFSGYKMRLISKELEAKKLERKDETNAKN